MAKYSYEFKKMIVDAYLNGEGGYKHLSSVYGPTRRDIQKWVNRFQAAGPDALRPHKKGRKKILDKSCKNPKIVPSEEPSVDTSAEYVKELEDELLKLRIENAFLKELRRLRLEDEAKMRERQESSAASEDSSN